MYDNYSDVLGKKWGKLFDDFKHSWHFWQF